MKAWDNFLALQEVELGVDNVKKWLRSFKIVKFDACNIYLQAKDSFHALWFEEHVRQKAQMQFLNNNSRSVKVHISIAGSKNSEKTKKNGGHSEQNAKEKTPPPFRLDFDDLDPYRTFEHLVHIPENELAFKVLSELTGYCLEADCYDASQRQLGMFNPIYLYGPAGCGKTHMLMAASHALRQQGLKVLYARAETFTHHVVSAIRSGMMNTFRDAYRNIDVLVIDDVQVFSKKRATQEEFFHTFNTLHVAGLQIILSSSTLPQELSAIEPRLISRFEWGIVVPLETANSEYLETILKKRANAFDFPLTDKVAAFLLEHFSRSSKSLMRALEALVLRCHMNHGDEHLNKIQVTPALARKYLSDLIKDEQVQAVTAERIIEVVASHFGIKGEDVISPSKNRDRVLPRQIVMLLCRTMLKLSFSKIGDILKRDHSTVMSGIKKIEKRLEEYDVDVIAAFSSIERLLQGT
jgi:chromosomal replication initiator protein